MLKGDIIKEYMAKTTENITNRCVTKCGLFYILSKMPLMEWIT